MYKCTNVRTICEESVESSINIPTVSGVEQGLRSLNKEALSSILLNLWLALLSSNFLIGEYDPCPWSWSCPRPCPCLELLRPLIWVWFTEDGDRGKSTNPRGQSHVGPILSFIGPRPSSGSCPCPWPCPWPCLCCCLTPCPCACLSLKERIGMESL